MSTRAIAGIILFCITMTGLFLANMYLLMMIGEINRKRPSGSGVSYFGFTFPKMVQIFGEYRQAYPGGHLHIYALSAFTIAMLCLTGVAVCLRIIG